MNNIVLIPIAAFMVIFLVFIFKSMPANNIYFKILKVVVSLLFIAAFIAIYKNLPQTYY